MGRSNTETRHDGQIEMTAADGSTRLADLFGVYVEHRPLAGPAHWKLSRAILEIDGVVLEKTGPEECTHPDTQAKFTLPPDPQG